ncbi:MAG: hypothetical protein J4N67_10660 [Chloroflexi bacterium]|nr:hypothetical protein [Chloroflexota bacterium]MCI0830585.1 hypothetical protein [Chloroflexota bacterium]
MEIHWRTGWTSIRSPSGGGLSGVATFSYLEVATLEIAGNANDNAMAASPGIISDKNPSLNPLAGPECSGFSDPSASASVVAIAIDTAVWLIPLNWGLAMELGRLCPRDKAWLGQDSAGGASCSAVAPVQKGDTSRVRLPVI